MFATESKHKLALPRTILITRTMIMSTLAFVVSGSPSSARLDKNSLTHKTTGNVLGSYTAYFPFRI